ENRPESLGHVERARLRKVGRKRETRDLAAVAVHLDNHFVRGVEEIDRTLYVDGLHGRRPYRGSPPSRDEVDPRGREGRREPAEAEDVALRRHDPDVLVDGDRPTRPGRDRIGQVRLRPLETGAREGIVFPDLAARGAEGVEIGSERLK